MPVGRDIRRRREPVRQHGWQGRLIGAHRVQNRANSRAGRRASGGFARQQLAEQIGQQQRRPALLLLGPCRDGPEFDGPPQQFPLLLGQPTQLVAILAGAFLAVQGQQLAEPALGGGGRLLGEQGEQQQSQGVIVGAEIDRILATVLALTDRHDLFRGHGGGGADARAGAVAVLALERTEIGQLEQRAPFADQNIAELQVAIDETGAVNDVQTVQNLLGPVENAGEIGRGSALPSQLRQPLAEIGLHPFQHQHRLAVHLVVREQSDDVTGLLVAETVEERDLPLQMRAPVAVEAAVGLGHGFGVDEFQGDGAAGGVGGGPDLTVAPRAGR